MSSDVAIGQQLEGAYQLVGNTPHIDPLMAHSLSQHVNLSMQEQPGLSGQFFKAGAHIGQEQKFKPQALQPDFVPTYNR